jgi:transposase
MSSKQTQKSSHFFTKAVSVSEIQTAIRTTSDEKYKTKLRAILLLHQGQSQTKVAETLVMSRRSIHSWIAAYNQFGLNALKTKTPGRTKGQTFWDAAPFERLVKEIDKHDRYWSIPLMVKWLQDNEKLTIPESTVWYRVTQIGYSHKSSRPHPYQGDPEKQNTFKKGV